jgi:hypothetical protein
MRQYDRLSLYNILQQRSHLVRFHFTNEDVIKIKFVDFRAASLFSQLIRQFYVLYICIYDMDMYNFLDLSVLKH